MAVLFLVFADPALAAIDMGVKPKKYDGIVTQVNAGDNSFVLRLRDGSFVTVKNPIIGDLFLSVKGVLDPLTNVIDKVTDFNIKDASSSDAIPFIARMDPGAGQWGTKINIFGSGFTKKNSISIGSYKNAITGVPAKNGVLTFSLPSKLCDKKLKVNCSPVKFLLQPGDYNISVSNENGVSNNVPFTVSQTPPLAIQNESLPQVVANTSYVVPLSATGGFEDYIWKIAGGALPPGLFLTQATCLAEIPCRAIAAIHGRPVKPGVYLIMIYLTSGTEHVSKDFSITVVQPLNVPAYSVY